MFLDNFLIAAEQVAILYILVAVGFIADQDEAVHGEGGSPLHGLDVLYHNPRKDSAVVYLHGVQPRVGYTPCDSRGVRRRDTPG